MIYDDLQAVRARLSSPECWCKHSYGNEEKSDIIGAIFRCVDKPLSYVPNAYVVVLDVIIEETPFDDIIAFNDCKSTSHSDMLTILDHAIEHAPAYDMGHFKTKAACND